MILLLIPALVTWGLIYALPTRGLRLFVLVLSPLPMLGVAWVYGQVFTDQVPPILIYAYGGLMLIVGALLVAAPPRFKAHQCERCGYDLSGVDRVLRCPECGTLTALGREKADEVLQKRRREVNRAHAQAIRAARVKLRDSSSGRDSAVGAAVAETRN